MNVKDSLRSRLEAGETIIMDGAMGTEIQRRGVRISRYAYMGEPPWRRQVYLVAHLHLTS